MSSAPNDHVVKAPDQERTLETTGVILLGGAIDTDSVKPVIERILGYSVSSKPPERITLMINSWGGSVFAAWGLIDVVEHSRIPVDTVGIGCILSAGLAIFLAGTQRTVTEHTSIMSHQFWMESFGKYHDLVSVSHEHNRMHSRMVDYYFRRMKCSKKKIEKDLLGPTDCWLSAAEAKNLGIVTHIKPHLW